MKNLIIWSTLAVVTALAGPAQAQLLIGQTAGFSGPVSAGVKEAADGARLWLEEVNANGGVHGQKIELISMDDKFDPSLAALNGHILAVQRKVLALFLTKGTPHTEALLALLQDQGIVLVGPSTGAMSLHRPVNKWLFNVRATYQREAERSVEHLVSVGVRRIAVVHVDDSFGRDAMEGVTRALARAGIKPEAVISADRTLPDYARIIPVIAGAQAVLWIGSVNAVAAGTQALRAAGSATQVVTLSNNASSGFITALGNASRGVIVTQVFPNERSIAYPFVKEALALARAKGMNAVSPAMLEGFAAAKVLVRGLQNAGPKPTREGLRVALEGLRKFDMGGLEVSYGAADHTGLDFADLSIIGHDGRFQR